MSTYVIGDIHGCADTLEELLSHLPSDADIYTTGDLIDRGPSSRRVITICMEQGIKPVMGNHEHMFLDFLDRTAIYPKGLFFSNGGRKTIQNYGFKSQLVAPEHIDFLKNLPLYIETDDFILSHAGVHQRKALEEVCDVDDFDEHNILWNRAKLADLGKLQVVGHTPTSDVEHLIVGDKKISVNIDTGCYSQHFGRLAALSIPEFDVIQVPCIDPVD